MGIAAERAFSPITFLRFGYPVKVSEEMEIARFVDSQHEFQAAEFYDRSFPLSADEADLVSEIAADVAAYTERHFGRPIRPWSAPFSALKMFRIITALAQRLGKEKFTVLEIGPGSGYLGALLHNSGYRHISMDNTQAFYLWQNRLYQELAGTEFEEFCHDGSRLVDDPSKKILHIPWWRFLEMDKDCPFSADFVVCDHAINELSDPALWVVLRVAADMLRKSDNGMFLFSEMGVSLKGDSGEFVFAEFERVGFQVLFKRLFHGLALRGSDYESLVVPHAAVMSTSTFVRAQTKLLRTLRNRHHKGMLELDAEIPIYNPSGSNKRYQPSDVIPLNDDEAPLDYRFVRSTGRFAPNGSTFGA